MLAILPSACPTCTVALNHEFISTFESLGESDYMEQAKKLAEKTVDFSVLAKKLVDEGRIKLKEGQKLGKLTYHDSCHLKRTLKSSAQPREILTKAGYEIDEMFESDMCCGMGGSYSIKLPEISRPILERKISNIINTGAPVVAMDCPGCVFQIGGGFNLEGIKIKVKHTIELIEEQLED